MTTRAYAFDAYGTLFDVHAAIARHRAAIGPDADALSALWRAKQLEYTWVRTLMGRYRDFWALTQEALDFALARYPSVDPALRAPLLDAYWRLEAYADVLPALTRLRRIGMTLALFTNGTREMAEAAASASAVLPLLDEVISVEPLRQFKTAPATYAHLCERLRLPASDICLVSSNRWDVAGGVASGLDAVWLNRAGQPDEYQDALPRRSIGSLSELSDET
ncbi:MAG: haloacid dehalogenase type II [Beijerinckiaceae bacterium]